MIKFAWIIAILLAVISYPVTQIEAKTIKSVKEEVKSSTWKKSTYEIRDKMLKLGFNKKLADYVVNECKNTALDPKRCITTATMIAKAESNCGIDAHWHNVWWINEGKKYDSDNKNFDRWLKSYNKFWYKLSKPEHFYPSKWEASKSNYCSSEESTHTKKWCPAGQRNAYIAYNTLTKI